MAKAKKKIKPIISRNADELADALNLPKSTAIEWQIRFEVTEEIIKMFNRSLRVFNKDVLVIDVITIEQLAER